MYLRVNLILKKLKLCVLKKLSLHLGDFFYQKKKNETVFACRNFLKLNFKNWAYRFMGHLFIYLFLLF